MWNYLNPRARHKLKQKGLKNPRSPLPWLKGNDVVAWIDAPLSHALMNDAITKSCVDFIDRNKDQPFFLYVPFPATHRPQIVLEERAKRIQALGCIDVPKYTQIAEVDTCVGAVVDTLRKHDLDRKTMVLYSNDNGGVSGFYKEGLTVPRGGKFGPKYEGTMRMATLAWWPGKIPAGVECDELVSSIDVFPTIAGLAGGEVPADRVIDGKDVSKVLLQKGASPNKQVFYMGTGVREGRWKLLKMSKTKSALFDLQEDFGETTDVSADQPEMVERLEKTLRAHQIALSKDRRPAGKASTAKPLLSDPTGLPTLAERLGRRGEKVYGVK
jgi:arylsulfatase A-like enzyme